MLINTATDLQTEGPSAERTAFLQSLLDDYTTFDDAEYPEGYDRKLKPEDDGYVEPVIRKEWNAEAATRWGFSSREEVEAALADGAEGARIRARDDQGRFIGDDPSTPDVNEAWTQAPT